MTHALKTWPEYMEDLIRGVKNFELRKDDRQFKVGDILLLQEYRMGTKDPGYTGVEVKKVITYILKDAPGFGLQHGYCILGLRSYTSGPRRKGRKSSIHSTTGL